jgi:hypothetical protein
LHAARSMAGGVFTPREVIRLMVDLLFIEDEETLTKKGIVRTLYLGSRRAPVVAGRGSGAGPVVVAALGAFGLAHFGRKGLA